jgi:tellurite resistance protein TerC
MFLHDIYKVPTTVSLAVIILIIAVSIIASLVKSKGQGRHEVEVDGRRFFESATEEDWKKVEPVFRKGKKRVE